MSRIIQMASKAYSEALRRKALPRESVKGKMQMDQLPIEEGIGNLNTIFGQPEKYRRGRTVSI